MKFQNNNEMTNFLNDVLILNIHITNKIKQ